MAITPIDLEPPDREPRGARPGEERLEPTPEERAARERLHRNPGRWRPPQGPIDVVRYGVDVEVAPEHAETVRKATADLRFYPTTGEGSKLRLMHGAGWARIELTGNVLGHGSALIRAPDGHVLFLAPGQRLFLHLTPEQLPVWREGAPQRVLVRDDTTDAGPRAGSFHVVETEALRAELQLDPDPRLLPFAAEAFTVLLGVDARRHPDLARLARAGFPVAGATWLGASRAAAPALRWRVSEVGIERVDPSPFDVPEAWANLRDTDAVARQAPQGGYTMDFERALQPRYDTTLDKSWFQLADTLNPVPVGPADSSQQRQVGSCIESRFGNAVGLHVTQAALDDVRTLVNLAMKRVETFQGENGFITVDWLRQFQDFADAQLPDGDGVFSLLRWPPDPTRPWPPEPGDDADVQASKRQNRFGGIALLDRIAERGARRLLASGTHAQLNPPPALLAACDALVADPSIAPQDRYGRLSLEDQAALRELHVSQRIGGTKIKYETESKINELPKGDTFPADLVRYKLYDLSLGVEVHSPGLAVADRGDVLRELSISGPNSIRGTLELWRLTGNAIVLRWPGWAYGAFGAGVVLACLFVPATCLAATALAAVATWLVMDAASVAITLRTPKIDFVVSWIPDANKNDKLLYPTVQLQIDTSSTTAVYVTAVPDGLHQIIDAVISLALSFGTDVEEAIADELRDQLQEALRDDAKLVYAPGQGALGQAVDAAGAFPAPTPRIGLGAFYHRPEHPVLPQPCATQVDTLDAAFANLAKLDGLYSTAFPPSGDLPPRVSRAYAAFAWSVNALNAYLWTLWTERRFDARLPPDPLGTPLAVAIAAAFPGLKPPLRDTIRVLSACPPRIELTPWTQAGGTRAAPPPAQSPLGDAYARVTFDDVRLCAPLEGSEAVLELGFPATVTADVVLGGLDASGALDLFGSPETSFELLFDLPTVTAGPWFTAGARVKDAEPVSPLAIAGLQANLAEAVRVMLAPRAATAVEREETDARNVQRYGLGPLALTSVLVPMGGHLCAFFGLPRLTMPRIPADFDPVGWLTDPTRVPSNTNEARTLLRAIDDLFH